MRLATLPRGFPRVGQSKHHRSKAACGVMMGTATRTYGPCEPQHKLALARRSATASRCADMTLTLFTFVAVTAIAVTSCDRSQRQPTSHAPDAGSGSPKSVGITMPTSPERAYTVTALRWADTQGRLWCLENRNECRELSVYKSYSGNYEMMIDVVLSDEQDADEQQRTALWAADKALNEAFYRIDGKAR